MPNERILVGGGTDYSNSVLSYYKFSYGNQRVSESSYSGVNYNKNYAYQTYKRWDAGNRLTVNKLFTGILPLQNTFDTGLVFFYGNGNPYNIVQIPVYFYFNLPVTLTKYRMWNGFASGNYSVWGGADISGDTPQDWNLQGSNDGIIGQPLTAEPAFHLYLWQPAILLKQSLYGILHKFSGSIQDVKLTVTKGGRNSVTYAFAIKAAVPHITQISRSEKCSFWAMRIQPPPAVFTGWNTFFPGLTYPNLDVTKRFEFFQGIQTRQRLGW
jgi:hypothetical protein